MSVPGIGDHATAISLYAAIVTGLYARERTGKGCNVSTSLIANGAWATAVWLQAGLFGAKFSGEIDRKNPPNALFGGSYRTSDNRWVLVCFPEEDKNWPVFAKAIERTDLLEDPRFIDSKRRHANAAALVAELDRVLGTQPLAYWKKQLDGARLPFGVVQIPDEIVPSGHSDSTSARSVRAAARKNYFSLVSAAAMPEFRAATAVSGSCLSMSATN